MKRSLGAQRTREWRGARTQMEAATLIGIDLYHYSKIERGAKKPGRALSVIFRDVAGVDPADWDRAPEPDVSTQAAG